MPTSVAERGDPRDAIKREDGFVASFFSAPIANWMLRRLCDSPVTPNQVTLASLAASLFASAAFATPSPTLRVVGAVLLQLSFVLDCLDGQLARHRGVASSFGAWLDQLTDRLRDVVLFAAIAVGTISDGAEPVSTFLRSYAATFVVLYRQFDALLLVRFLGSDYEDLHREPVRARDADGKVRVVDHARARRRAAWGPIDRALDVLAPKGTHERRPGIYWLKRAALLEGGERYLLISILVVAGHMDWIFPLIVVWGAFVYPLITLRRWSLFGGKVT